MGVRVYTPQIEVTLVKMLDRKDGMADRFTKAERVIDLTGYLGEAGAVQTTKSITEACGAFSISFADDIQYAVKDSLHVLIEPMDLIEIRGSRDAAAYAGERLPLIMRGFVSSIRRTESMGQDGSPARAVVISGHDFGKLWMIHGVWYEKAEAEGQPLLTVFGLLDTLGFAVRAFQISDFIKTFCLEVMNVRVKELRVFAKFAQQVRPFVPECSVKQGEIMPRVQETIVSGPYWNIIKAASDGPWNELFVRDEEDGPHLIFRPAPYKDLKGNYILDDAADPGTVDIGIDEVVQWDVTRTDGRVGNFFWVPPGGSSFDTNAQATAGSIVDATAFDFKHGNNKPELFGYKKMQAETILIPNGTPGISAEQPAASRAPMNQNSLAWHKQRAKELQAMNRDNSVFEDGGATIMGHERIVIGKYIRLTRGQLVSEAYVTSVSHSIQPLSTWSTTISFERGTGFLERNRLKGSPFIAEGRDGPYSGTGIAA